MILIQLSVGSRYPVNRQLLRERALQVLAKHSVEAAQLDVSIVGVRKITQLNETLLHHEGSTDVLSFPQHEKAQLDDFPLPDHVPPHLGDIVISFPAAVESAKRYGRRVDDQLCFYLEHGLLHLLGYHHD